jgi:hypothetical protein
MILTEEIFRNGTEVDLTNNFHEDANLTLCLNIAGKYEIKNYVTNETYLEFTSLGEAIDYCNNNFDTNFKTI